MDFPLVRLSCLALAILVFIAPTLPFIWSTQALVGHSFERVVGLDRDVGVNGVVLHNGNDHHSGSTPVTQPGLDAPFLCQ